MAESKMQSITTKRLAIDKANAQMVAVVAVASFVAIFCLVASKAVWSQTRYQSRVTAVKEKAHEQLKRNSQAFNDLSVAYGVFDETSTNLLGGSRDGSGNKDGSNSQIVIDALPSAYDFPALTSSLEKILSDQNLKVASITGTDDQLNQQGNLASPTPKPVSIPFSFSVSDANYSSVNGLLKVLEQSIRPMQIDSLELSGGTSNMTVNIKAHTYYQPAKSLTITKKVVK